MVLDNIDSLILEIASRGRMAKVFGDVAYKSRSEFRKDPRVRAAKIQRGREAFNDMGVLKQAEVTARALTTNPKETMKGALRGAAAGTVAGVTSQLDPTGYIGGIDVANIKKEDLQNAVTATKKALANPTETAKKVASIVKQTSSNVADGVKQFQQDVQENPKEALARAAKKAGKAWWRYTAGSTSIGYKPILGALDATTDERALLARRIQQEEIRKQSKARRQYQDDYYRH